MNTPPCTTTTLSRGTPPTPEPTVANRGAHQDLSGSGSVTASETTIVLHADVIHTGQPTAVRHAPPAAPAATARRTWPDPLIGQLLGVGLNLAGVAMVLELEAENAALRAEL